MVMIAKTVATTPLTIQQTRSSPVHQPVVLAASLKWDASVVGHAVADQGGGPIVADAGDGHPGGHGQGAGGRAGTKTCRAPRMTRIMPARIRTNTTTTEKPRTRLVVGEGVGGVEAGRADGRRRGVEGVRKVVAAAGGVAVLWALRVTTTTTIWTWSCKGKISNFRRPMASKSLRPRGAVVAAAAVGGGRGPRPELKDYNKYNNFIKIKKLHFTQINFILVSKPKNVYVSFKNIVFFNICMISVGAAVY